MHRYSVSDVKTRTDDVLTAAESEPVAIERDGLDDLVVVSASRFALLTGSPQVSEPVREAYERSLKKFGKVYEALAK